jgi:hypothetical protein
MKKILVPFIAALALGAPQSASADAGTAAPLCHNGSISPVVVNVRCASGNTFCLVYVYANTGGVLATQRHCVTL